MLKSLTLKELYIKATNYPNYGSYMYQYSQDKLVHTDLLIYIVLHTKTNFDTKFSKRKKS